MKHKDRYDLTLTLPLRAPRSEPINWVKNFLNKGSLTESIGATGHWEFRREWVSSAFVRSGDYYRDASIEISEILKQEERAQ